MIQTEKTDLEVSTMEKLKNARLYLLDMDGTLYLGDEVISGAVEFIKALEDTGREYIYLTNNSSRAGEDYVLRLNKLGFPCRPENVFTSGMATAMYLNEKFPRKPVYPVGTKRFTEELASFGVNLSAEEPAAVVVGFDTELCYEKLNKAVRFIRRGAEFIGANPDFVCPMPKGEVLPDCGSICRLISAASGKEPFFIGKPNRRMIDIISKKTGIPNGEIAMVGDRLYTDIAAGINAGAVSVCVMSGETTEDMLKGSDIKPDLVFPSVKEIGDYLKRTLGR